MFRGIRVWGWLNSQRPAYWLLPNMEPPVNVKTNEATMRKLDQLSPALQSSLTDYQIAWVMLQRQALNISDEQLTGTILNEWLSNHPDMMHGRHEPKQIIRHALDDFIQCHFAEFLPVTLSDLPDQD